MVDFTSNLKRIPRAILPSKEKTRYIDLQIEEKGLISKFISSKKIAKENDFSDLELLRQLLTKEKIKLLHLIKKEKVSSIYQLAKKADRDFKTVWQDLKLLERFGVIEFNREKKGGRYCLVPVVVVNKLSLIIEF